MIAAALPAGGYPRVPVDPDAETAREWVRAELLEPAYNQQENLLSRALTWLWDLIQETAAAAGQADAVGALVVAAGVLLMCGAIALLVAGPVRRNRAGARTSVDVFGEDTRSAAELRAAADAHAAAGRWSEAVLDRFRALLRALEDRALLDERPGRTAHEATEDAGARLPERAADLRRAGRLFDDVCYGDAEAGPEDDAWLRDLDARVTATRPGLVQEPVASGAPVAPR